VKYLLLICADPTIEPPEEVGDIDVWFEGGSRLITDGPFAETKEVIAGYDVIECETEDQAIEIAGLHPVAKFGSVEVRPLWNWVAPA